MDLTPIEHAFIAAAAQTSVGIISGDWLSGAALACMWFIAREHTQAEYRWIEKFGKGLRSNMPWWGGLDPKAWTFGSALDAITPICGCFFLYITARDAVL